jgi:hypothetical protein
MGIMKTAVHIVASIAAGALLSACGQPASSQEPAAVDGATQYRAGVNLALQLQNQSEEAAIEGSARVAHAVTGPGCASGTIDNAGNIVVTWTCKSLAGRRLVLQAVHRTAGGACFKFDQGVTTVPAAVVSTQPSPGNC